MSNEAKVDNYFSSPIWLFDKPEWVKSVNKVCDKYIKEAYKRDKDKIKNSFFAFGSEFMESENKGDIERYDKEQG